LIERIQNILKIPDLKKRILFTFAMLVVYRVGAHIPIPGIDGRALASFFESNKGGLLGFFDLFSGGALSRLTVFALGIMPYIDAAIIIELLNVVIPSLEKLSKEGGEEGRKKITQYTRYGTIGISVVQSLGISIGLESMHGASGAPIVLHTGWGFRLMTIITLTAGTTFLMWLGEQVTERGIGNGISLIITAGIIVRLPSAILGTFSQLSTGEMKPLTLIILAAVMLLVVAAIVFVEKGERRINIKYPKKVVGRKTYGGSSTYLPLKVNTAGVIPVIFASSIIMFPATIARFVGIPFLMQISDWLSPGRWMHNIFYVVFIVFFCYFYTAIVFNPSDVADNLKKWGGFIPGVRPGKNTADYIDRVLSRITAGGASYLSLISLLPTFLIFMLNTPFYFGGIALLIVIEVFLDTVRQVESYFIQRNYDGFLQKKSKRGMLAT